MKIKCTTLYDITKTDVGRRQSVIRESSEQERALRNKQINYETLLQIISMRCQPENISTPKATEVKKDKRWGTQYSSKLNTWEFTFDVYAREVFNDGTDKLGNLYKDSVGVPMIVKLEETPGIATQISIEAEFKNIHYEIIEDDSPNY